MNLRRMRAVMLQLDLTVHCSDLQAPLVDLPAEKRRNIGYALRKNGFDPALLEGNGTPADLILAMLVAASARSDG
jgi:hypothetical protein